MRIFARITPLPLVPLALLIASAAFLSVVGPLAEHPVAVLGAYLLSGSAWLMALHLARSGRVGLQLVVVGAVLLRLFALACDLRTSDDAPRLAWEGRVLLAGASPYAFAPDAPELADLALAHPRLHAAVNHRDVAAAYPPLAQAVGVLAAASLGDADEPEVGVRTVRGLFAALDLLMLVPLVALLRRRALPDGLALVWGWCPLAAFEVAGAGHLEALALLPLLGALVLGERSRGRAADMGAAALFALAILAKILPIVLLPWFVRSKRWRWRTAWVLAFVVMGTAPFLPPLSPLRGAERGLLLGVSEYALRWDGLNVVHRFVEGACALALDRGPGWTDPRRVARALLAAAWLAWAWRTWRRERDPARTALDLFGAWIVLTPILHPWYALWCVPWLAMRRAPAFAFLVVAIPLAFAPVIGWQQGGAWVEPVWLWPVVALPFVLLLVRSALAPRSAREHARDLA